MEDLWPNDLTSGKVLTPVAILKEQGSFLGRKTKDVVIGEVKPQRKTHDQFTFEFVLRSSALDEEFLLFAIYHPVELYPVEFDWNDDEIFEGIVEYDTEEADTEEADTEEADTVGVFAENEEQFIDIVRKILNAKKTKQIVQGIIALSEG